jgi:hypothetical protein
MLDKAAAKRAAMLNRAAGSTALFDALARVTLDFENRPGKKAVIVFTDGDDNASVLNFQRATDQAKKSAIPLYTVLKERRARRIVDDPPQRDCAFDRRQDLQRQKRARDRSHLSRHRRRIAARIPFIPQPPEAKDDSWRGIRVTLRGEKEYKDYAVRSKEGNFSR